QQALVTHVFGQQRLEAVKGVTLDLVRVADRLCIGVGVALFVRHELAEEVGEVRQHLCGAWRAEADRVGQAVVYRDAPVGQARRQKHVVVVEVRANAATRCGVADHHIIDAPAWQEAKVFQQFGHFRDELVNGLNQQRPFGFR
nr:hypothetical protein [Tanacetum cinerariifolium]